MDYITPDGGVYSWIGGTGGNNGPLRGTLLAQLNPLYHASPQLLFNAADPVIPVAPGSRLSGPDFANYTAVTISGQVFSDVNQNGVRDASENYKTGQQIQLIDRDGNLVMTVLSATVDRNGNSMIEPETEAGSYLFSGVAPGRYTVRTQLGTNQIQTAPFPDRFTEFAFQLDQRLQLESTGNLFENFGANQERWIYSKALAEWTYINQAGELYKWDGVSSGAGLSGTLITRLNRTYYDNPELLYNAQTTRVDLQSGDVFARDFGVLDLDELFTSIGDLL
ncbi:MAG: SdrD B-like domain-containing protein [Planctomycetaceae bacterium]